LPVLKFGRAYEIEERVMIKVIMGYKLKEGVDIQPALLKIRSHAMTYPGFVGAENLVGVQDSYIVASVSTWERPEDWLEWRNSKVTEALVREVETFLVEKPWLTIYRIMPQ
jgi:heme-degrading monooxygenase HmoA